MSKQGFSSGFSINSFINKEEKEKKEETVVTKTDNLPQHHFTETDLLMEWNLFLKQIQFKQAVVYNAVKSFKLVKIDESNVQVLYPSDSAKVEFDKISGEFFNHFKRKVLNYSIEIDYKKDIQNLKIEVVTKKKIFEKFIEKNPLLKDLDDLMKFDLS
ncbi:hypothetical protein [Chryseobacterium paludis]|uniref:hypothetical protein n=1 Tax=Chryseobacterium paludis TaxID=2956784 RepID=UPI0021C147F0|nr:hypothetical protein [Chryseobacterium paludis]